MARNQRRLLQLYAGVSETSDRHATWLELFFDLVFVVAIAIKADFAWAGAGGDRLCFADWIG